MDLSRKIAIVGGGIAAAYTYRAVIDTGFSDITVFGGDFKKPIGGAFWLRWLPEQLSKKVKSSTIFIQTVGSAEVYMRNQWGEKFQHYPSSFPKGLRQDIKDPDFKTEIGYDPGHCWDYLWGQDLNFVRKFFTENEDFIDLLGEFDVVLSTIALPMDKRSWLDKVYERTIVSASKLKNAANNVVYVGLDDSSIIRFSYVWGKTFYEIGYNKVVDLDSIYKKYSEDVVQFHKFPDIMPDVPALPITSDISDRLFLIGRYAQWNRTLLSHECYKITQEILANL